MSLSQLDRERIDQLLTALYDGRLDEAESARLLDWLEEPEAQDLFASHAMLDAFLSMACADPQGIAPLKPAVQGSVDAQPAEKGGPDDRATSPVPGFLGNLTQLGGSSMPTLWTLLVLVSGMVLTLALVIVLAIRGIRVEVNQPELAGSSEQGARSKRPQTADTKTPPRLADAPHRDAKSSGAASSPASAPARLVYAKDCTGTASRPAPGLARPCPSGRR